MTDPELTYLGEVTDAGEIRLPKKMRTELIAAFRGKPIKVTVKRKRKRRSDPQNRYYWGCIVRDITAAIREADPETGWTAEMVHEVLKAKFLPVVREWAQVVNEDTAEVIAEPPTTTKLTTTEMERYHDLCRKWGSEFFGISIAAPNEQAEMAFNF